ncbi:c-type cytochrome biogenesis protein CcmI [Klebsiella aerogenes]|nr:c-type cytochrome biogenesis protein CcmI [Klebsiella aerogenes]EIW8577104.1 c-type cytochrome biogenesis protein CcmI [Klebsiella aerogenes]NPD98599.1 c-type cytochrome biogenesis protein CcmI [Klebsiella aerogenes]HEI8896979.1 c-type cytochrome biogenesis protein CcmI [Klebsiella aerogenes]
MMPELGNYLLCLAAGLALLLSIFPLWGAARQERWLMALARPLACALFICIIGAFALLVHAFVINDFTVRYVAENSNSALPAWYRVAATWGAHEGSLLLWVLLLSVWTFAVALFSRQMPTDAVARVLAVMGMIAFGFLLFILFTSNPFSRSLPLYPVDGRDLNPMLQDIGMIFHPPILYMGYVGFSVAFAFAIASLLAGRLDTAWARWSRPWTQAAWMFLTLGIVLGSAWAYYELGWGGWWFWDPVENASFMPWLVGTALLHSLAVTEKRGSFRAWTVLLALAAFSLCLLGTFLVRSGVLVSVHSFASDPARGMFILALLTLAIGGSLLLYAVKGGRVRARVEHTLWSRESFLLGNNILLMAAMLVVLLGTLLPLVHKALGLGTISIGEPFFNTMFTALMAPFALLLGLGPLIRWRRDEPGKQLKRLAISLVVTLSLSLALPWLLQDRITAMAVIGLMMALWVLIFALIEVHERATHRHGFWRGLRTLTRSQWGMVLGHVGVAVTVIGITFSQNYSIERDVRMRAGDSLDIHRYHFVFKGVRNIVGPNWSGGEGVIAVSRNGRPEAMLYAEKRFYTASRMMMTEAAISGGFTRDLYAALGEELDDGSWAVRLYYKPFVRWIWYGGVLMALGGLCCMLDPRYRRSRQQKTAVARNDINRSLYQSRLRELEQERTDGNEAMIVELQRTLLADISPQEQTRVRPLSRWLLLPGALLLVFVSGGLYLKTSDVGQVLLWRQSERHYPALLAQAKDPTATPLRMDELAQLRLGLRSHLQDSPDDLAGWQLLGRLGLLLNDGETAIGAFGRVHKLAPDDPAASFDYASALVRAGDNAQMRMGELLLRDLHQRQPKNLPVLEMLALSAVRNEDYPQAVAALQQLLMLLPEGDARREAIARQLAQAQQAR